MKPTAPSRRNVPIPPKNPAGRRRTERSAGLLFLLLLTLSGCSLIPRGQAQLDRSADPAIVSAVQRRLAAEPELSADVFRVESNGGFVSLYGTVYGLGQWSCALRNAHLVDGVVSVIDYLTIERGEREIRCLAPRGSD